jgi:hypothetical protein
MPLPSAQASYTLGTVASSKEVWTQFWYLMTYFNNRVSLDNRAAYGDANFGHVSPAVGTQSRTLKHDQVSFGPTGHSHQWENLSYHSIEKRNFDLNGLSVLWQNYYAGGERDGFNFHPIIVPGQVSITFAGESYKTVLLPSRPDQTSPTGSDMVGRGGTTRYDSNSEYWTKWNPGYVLIGYMLAPVHKASPVSTDNCFVWAGYTATTGAGGYAGLTGYAPEAGYHAHMKFSTTVASGTYYINFLMFGVYYGATSPGYLG